MTEPAAWRFEPADVAIHLRRAGDELDAILLARGVSQKSRFAARLVAEEIVLNAFEYGGANEVTMSVDPANGPHRLVFEDDGVPFDPATLLPPKNGVPVSEVARGRGLILVRGLTKTIEHHRAGGRNRLGVQLED